MQALIVIAGLPGVGKSYIADKIAQRIDTGILRTDEIRKELAGIPAQEHRYEEFGKDIYSDDIRERTYEEMIKRGRMHLSEGRSCIFDATFSKRRYRKIASELAEELKIPFLVVECVCPEEVVMERIKSRTEKGSVSDATVSIYKGMKENFEEIKGDEIKIVVDTSGDLEEIIEGFMAYLRATTKIPKSGGTGFFSRLELGD